MAAPISSNAERRSCASLMASNTTLILRVTALLALLVLTVLSLVMSVQLAQQSLGEGPGHLPAYVVMGLAISSTSALALLPVTALQIARPTCAPFYVGLEIFWTALLGSAWFALAIKQSLVQVEDTSLTDYIDRPKLAARFTALQDAAFLAWAILWSWSLWMTILALRASRSGQQRILHCPTRQVKFLEIKPVLVVDHSARPPRGSEDSEKSTASNPR
jgi:hypothetical protein